MAPGGAQCAQSVCMLHTGAAGGEEITSVGVVRMRRGAQCKGGGDVSGRQIASGGESFVIGPPAFNGQKLKLYAIPCPPPPL